jgi:hypothetical protein
MLADADKFDGTKWVSFKPKYTASSKLCGLFGYHDRSIPCPLNPAAPTLAEPIGTATTTPPVPAPITVPLPPDPTPIYSKNPSFDEWNYRDGLATSLLTLNVKDPVGVGLKSDGTAREPWLSLETVYGRVSNLALSHAVRELNTTYHAAGTPMTEHVVTMRTLRVAANDMGAKVEDPMFRTIFINSLNKGWS